MHTHLNNHLFIRIHSKNKMHLIVLLYNVFLKISHYFSQTKTIKELFVHIKVKKNGTLQYLQ